jgi:hypothetical protein
MLIECDNCGAPLDVTGDAATSRCHYCGKTSEVKRLKTVATETPEGWVPPKAWTPPEHTSLPREPLLYRPMRAIGRIVSFWLTFGGIVVVGLVGWRVSTAVQQAANAPLAALQQSQEVQNAVKTAVGALENQINAAARAPGGGTGVPLVCSGNDAVTVTAKDLSAPGGTPIQAAGNCTLRLVNCTASGAVAIDVAGNARVTIEGGTFTATRAAITLAGNGFVDATAGARFSGEPAVNVSGNATARFREASLAGRRIAIETSGNASVEAAGATIQGAIAGTRRVRR